MTLVSCTAPRTLGRVVGGACLAGLLLSLGSAVEAAPVSVRTPECPVYGVLALRSETGDILAHGELVQTLGRDHVESRLTFRFRDGSAYDEKVTYTQTRVFALRTYQLSQRGPSFPHALEIQFERMSGRYSVRSQEKPSEQAKTLEGRLDLPDDVYNGMASLLIRNLPPGGRASAHMLAFTPKPRLLTMELVPTGEDTFFVGSTPRQARRYLVDLELPGLVGMVASIAGKKPPDLRYWIAAGPVPASSSSKGRST